MADETPRKQVAAAILAAHPSWAVDNYPNEPERVRPGKPYVDVYESRRAPDGDDTRWRFDVECHAYTGKAEPAAAEDDAEDIRDDVLTVLQAMPGLFIEEAERVVFMDAAYIGYKIKAYAHSVNPYTPKEV